MKDLDFLVKNHYLKDAISRMMTGKADTVVFRKPGEPKRTETKSHLLMSVAEAYALFKANHPDIEIGKSRFFELCPKHVLVSSKTPQNVYVCQQHTNVILLLDGLHRKIKEIPLYTRQEFLGEVVSATRKTNIVL